MPRRQRPRRASTAASTPSYRWLILVHLLPSTPSNLRVRTWRRLQQLGALAVKQSVYVLPDSPAAREDFEWLKTEIVGAGGEATVFAADTIDAWSADALVDAFRRARQADYAALSRDVEKASKQAQRKSAGRRGQSRTGRPALDSLRQRLADLQRIDFFGSPGRDRAEALVAQLEQRLQPPTPRQAPAPCAIDPRAYRKRHWVTRPRPGVDRMASAWLIRRFIDPDATFGFAADSAAAPGAVAFDMFDGEFSHQGDRCTFETLRDRFAVRDPAVARIAAVVHDLDMKDGKFGRADAPAIGEIIDGMQLACERDDRLLEQGIGLFEALYRSARQRGRTEGTEKRG